MTEGAGGGGDDTGSAPAVGNPRSGTTQAEIRRSHLRPRAWRITGVYALIATFWIYFSDLLLSLIMPDPAMLVRWSVFKGLTFVVVTSVFLLFMLQRAFGTIESAYTRLREYRHEIERLNRLYSARGRINQAIVVAATRQELFERTCSVLVGEGGFHMAWLGWQDTDGRLLPVAQAGDDSVGAEQLINPAHGEDQAQHRWHEILASGRPYICNDLLLEPQAEPWRQLVRNHKLHACAILPVSEQGRRRGLLTVCAGEVGFFRDKEVALLTETAVDISQALDSFALADEREHARGLAARESQFSDAMIESMPGILYFYDERGNFLRWNRNFEQVSGYTGAEIAAMHPLQFFAGEEKHLLEKSIAEVFEAGEASVEAMFLSKDGSSRPYFFTGRSVMYEGGKCLVGVGIDISERRQAERALRELNETLESKVMERTRELEAAVIRAEAADRLKSAFLATMSHELRTPLNSIIGFTGIVLQELAGPLTAEQAKQLNMVRGSARHLLELINDVLDLSKIEAGQLEVRAEQFDLRESIERAVASVSPQTEKKSLALQTFLPPTLPQMLSDRRRVEQILLNLLNNAIKFTDHGRITLNVDIIRGYRQAPEAPAGDAVQIRVADTGMGIRQEDLAKLFQPFSQLDSGLSRQHDGSGLGLMICRRLADLLGGDIEADSRWSEGSEFTVRLPLAIAVSA